MSTNEVASVTTIDGSLNELISSPVSELKPPQTAKIAIINGTFQIPWFRFVAKMQVERLNIAPTEKSIPPMIIMTVCDIVMKM